MDKSPTAEVNKDYFQPESVHGVVEKSKNRDNRKRTFDSSLSDGGVSQRGKNPKIEALMNEIINGSSNEETSNEEPENIPRTKGDIIGYSNDDAPNIGVKILPSTVAGLWKRFNAIYPNRRLNRNELVSILDTLLRLNGITRAEYSRYNNIISSESINHGHGIDEDIDEKDENNDNDKDNDVDIDDSDENNVDDENNVHDDDSDNGDSDEDEISDNDLRDKFNRLFVEFTRTKKNGGKLVKLSDEMLSRGLITLAE